MRSSGAASPTRSPTRPSTWPTDSSITWGSKISYAPPSVLQQELCANAAPFAFVQLHFAITPAEEACLIERHASSLDFHGGGDQLLRLWLVQASGEARFTPRVIGEPDAHRVKSAG